MRKYVSERMSNLPVSSIRVIFDKCRRMNDVVRFEIGEPDLDTPKNIKEAAKLALDEGFTHYTPFNGFEDLRQQIGHKFETENGFKADPEKEIIVTPGACSAVYGSLISIINPGEEVLVPDPGWPHYEVCVIMGGGIPVNYPQFEKNDFKIDPNDIASRVTAKTKAIVINSPSNPTGAVLDRKILEKIAKIAKDNDLIVMIMKNMSA
jgi:aspartate/methionine/tyrosine aminotransferase